MKKRVIVSILTFLLIFSHISFSYTQQTEYNLTYDANGNIIQGFGKYFEYDNFNQLKTIGENNAGGRIIEQHFYDHNGDRLKKIEFFINGTNITTYYIDNFVQTITTSPIAQPSPGPSPGSGGVSVNILNTTYYYHDGDLVAENNSKNNRRFYHPDHLGSTTLVTNISGGITEYVHYLPYGDLLSSSNSRYQFTGKEKDKEVGLYYYGARYYDPYFRHFIQPDTIISDIYNPQALNRYSYALNNPYKYNDPSGNIATLVTGAIGAAIGAVIGAVTSIISQIHYTGQINLGQVGIGSIIGAAYGGVAGLTFGLGTAAIASGGFGTAATAGLTTGLAGLSSAIGGGAAQLASNLFTGAPASQNVFNPKDRTIDAALGVGTAAVGYGIGALRGASGTKAIPNPYGKLGGPEHQAVVNQIVKDIESRGYLAKTEYAIKNAEGKPIRYVDVVALDKTTNQPVEFHQVGRTTSSGEMVARERAAIVDIQRAEGKDVIYHPYDR
ncbi:hypothetical protein HYV49_04555 [Candidatus Pacearchaeota archaeon]|nr:hypothetical protein [Candidatus Pacearchaeota archaeon]